MNIGIFIYNDAEVLDFSGPFEVFSIAKRLGLSHWNASTIAAYFAPLKTWLDEQNATRQCGW